MMYQTVGHEMVELLAEAMQLPLFRQTVEGSCKSAEKVQPMIKKGFATPFSSIDPLPRYGIDLTPLLPRYGIDLTPL